MNFDLRFLKISGTKFMISFSLAVTSSFYSFSQTPCDVSQLIPVWARLEDSRPYYGPNYDPGPRAYLTANFDSKKMTPKLEVALSWIKGYFEGIKGARFAEYRYSYDKGFTIEESLRTNPWFLATNRLGSYNLRVYSRKTYCSNGRLSEYDGPARIDITFNELNYLIRPLRGQSADENGNSIPFQINGKPAFEIPNIKWTKGNIDYYQYPGPPPPSTSKYSNWDFLDVFILRKNDKPLFLPFTRKEILESQLIDLEGSYKEMKRVILEYTQVLSAEEIDKQLEERIAEIKRFTEQGVWGYSKENLENRIQLAIRNSRIQKEEEAGKIENALSNLNRDYQAAVDLIQNYLANQPASVLAKPVREYFPINIGEDVLRKIQEDFDRELTIDDWGQDKMIGYINPDYFDSKLSPDVPQLIAVEFFNLDGVHSHLNEVVDKINQKLDFKALQALIPDVSMAAAPADEPVKMTAKSPARYLEKLDNLEPFPFGAAETQASRNPTFNLGGPGFNAPPIQIRFPERTSDLSKLAVLSSSAVYENYLDELKGRFLTQLSADQKRNFDQWIKEYDLKTEEEFTQLSMLAWINSNPYASIYLDLEAVKRFPESGLAANNLAVHLLKSGNPDRSLPILNYWLKEFPDNSLLMGNAATARYYLGDVDGAFELAKKTVEQDSLHPNANKILAFVHRRNGQKAPAKKAAERSLETSYDEELVAILQEMDNEAEVGKTIYAGRKSPFTPQLLDKFRMPEAIQGISDAPNQSLVIDEVLGSIGMTIAAIPRVSTDSSLQAATQKNIQQVMTRGGFPLMQMLGQHMYFKSMQEYQEEYTWAKNRFVAKLQETRKTYNAKAGEINRRYNAEMAKIEGGEDWEGEKKLAELQRAKCKELNLALDSYYKETAPLINQAVVRLELISRDHHSTVAYWAPIWLQSQEAADFPGTQINYLREMRELLKLYPTELPMDCELFGEEEEEEDFMPGKILVWEDQYCPVKFTIGMGPVKGGINCNTFSLSGGEFLQFEGELKLNRDWDTVEEVSVGGGVGVSLDVGWKGKGMISTGLSTKLFAKLSKDPKTLEWNFRKADAGLKTEATMSGELGPYGLEVKLAETSMGIRSGITSDGSIPKMIDLALSN
ncbi:tetratricopeptide repeat protein [Shivajiella indica]|uniref:Tetratricopeptide repeat protein n=1 Tax=Shivajiella indica TaxID=872115 RepID=A0ABW5B9U8_9BACT